MLSAIIISSLTATACSSDHFYNRQLFIQYHSIHSCVSKTPIRSHYDYRPKYCSKLILAASFKIARVNQPRLSLAARKCRQFANTWRICAVETSSRVTITIYAATYTRMVYIRLLQIFTISLSKQQRLIFPITSNVGVDCTLSNDRER